MRLYQKRLFTGFVLLVSLIGSASAQTVSFEEFEKKVDGRAQELDKFRAVLSDSDPNRRIAAIEFMVASGDPVLERLAKREGLHSADAAVRATTLKAILDDLPALEFNFDAPDETTKGYRIAFTRANGNLREDGTGFQVHKLEAYDDKKECYTIGHFCFVRLTGETVSFHLNGRWAGFRLNKEGELVGQPTLNDQTTQARVPLVE